jgi:hypothetical protein
MNGSIQLSQALDLARTEAKQTRSTRYVYRDSRGFWNVVRTRPLLAACRVVDPAGGVSQLDGPLTHQRSRAREKSLSGPR